MIENIAAVVVIVGLPILLTVVTLCRADQPRRRANGRYPLTRHLTK